MESESVNEQITDRPPPSTGIIILGVLGIGLGLLIFCLGAAGFMGMAMQSPGDQANPMAELQNDPVIRAFSAVGAAVNLVAGIAFVVSSIGLFRLRQWAWKLGVGGVGAFLLWLLLSALAQQIVVAPRAQPFVDEYLESEDMEELPDGFRQFTRFAMTNGSVLTLCCCFPFPLILLVGLLVPSARKQFFPPGADGVPPPQGFDEPRGPDDLI